MVDKAVINSSGSQTRLLDKSFRNIFTSVIKDFCSGFWKLLAYSILHYEVYTETYLKRMVTRFLKEAFQRHQKMLNLKVTLQ